MERNYALLEQERKEISIPFPEVHPYDTGIDYEDISDIQYKKGQNQPAWDRIAVVDRYLTASKLFVGHCLMQGGANYYIIDHPSLASKNQITPEQCYALKGDKLVLERLAQKTLGDPDAYTDVTFCDIISEIQQEAEIEGALKEKKKNEIIMEERDKANDAIIQQMMASKRELQSDLVHHLNESLRNAKKELEIQQQRLDEVEVSVKRFKKRLNTFIIVCAVVVAFATACAIITNEAIYTITSVVVAIAIWTISAISSKELSPRSIYKWAISKWRLRQCKRRHCSDEEKRLLEEKIDTLKADIAKYEDSALSA